MTDVEFVRAVEPMAPNLNAENTTPEVKRKLEDGTCSMHAKKAKVDAASASQPKPAAPLIELNGRKLVFHPKVDKANITMPFLQAMLAFNQYLIQVAETGEPMKELPEVHWALLALAGHESTARTELVFVKQLKASVLTVNGSDDELPNDVLLPIVHKLFAQEDYGFLPGDFPSSSRTPSKVPATLQLRYWEVREPEKWVSGEVLEGFAARLEERRSARRDCLEMLASMSEEERMKLLKGDKLEKATKAVVVDKVLEEPISATGSPAEASRNVFDSSSIDPVIAQGLFNRKTREGTANTVGSTQSARSVSPTKKSKMTPEEEEAARQKREEKEVRKAAKAEKKAAEEREQERKKNVIAKQAQAMSSFFKPRIPVPKAPMSAPSAAPVEEDGPSDFQKIFKPVQSRPNVFWADINKWRRQRSRQVAVQDDATLACGSSAESSINGWQASDFLSDHLKQHGRRKQSTRSRHPLGLKTAAPFGTVKDVWDAHEDAEDPRAVLEQLKNRRRFPWKVLAFDGQVRPPYCGTFTKPSVIVGPRTPFAQDPALDYSYDSGDDWQDDEGGEDVDDPGEGAKPGSDDESSGEEEGEFDDWLDDSEDVRFQPGEGSEGTPEPVLAAEQTTLPRQVIKQKPEAPKKVVKLTPFWRGPMWESVIGDGAIGMEGYRLELLNETPDQINPFTYTSLEPDQSFKSTFSTTVIGTNLAVKCLLSAEPMAQEKQTASAAQPAATSASDPTLAAVVALNGDAKPKQSGPKVAFPESHLPELLSLIEGNKKMRPDLVSQLREKFEGITSKGAIEAKIKEVAERGRAKNATWKVFPQAWLAAGLPVPLPPVDSETAPSTETKTNQPAPSATSLEPVHPTSHEPAHAQAPASSPLLMMIDTA